MLELDYHTATAVQSKFSLENIMLELTITQQQCSQTVA